ncbi:MAG: hypothetical protein JWR63_97 [Conexibacter sp.]|nr:hypothetical protein [Conexibacter sp.]
MTFDLDDPRQLALRAPTYALAFEEAGHALDGQERAVADLTARAGVLMAAAAVTTSIFGGQVLRDGHRVIATWVAIGAFLGVGVAVLAVLWPRHDWEFGAQPKGLLAQYAEPAHTPLAMIHRDLAIHRSASFARNTRQLRSVLLWLRVGMCLLAVEVVAWVVAFADVT